MMRGTPAGRTIARRAPIVACLVSLAVGPAADAASTLDAGPPEVIPGLERPPIPPRPGASLLLGQPPRAVSFVLDGPTRPTLPLLTTFRDASIERWGPLRVYTNGRWGRWLEGAWWSYDWAPRLVPGDDLEPAGAEAHDDASVGAGPARSSFSSGATRTPSPAPASWSTSPTPPGIGIAALLGPRSGPGDRPWLGDRRWIGATSDDRARPLSPLFDSSGPSLMGDGFDVLFDLPPSRVVVDWRCRPRPVTIIRYGGESDAIELLRCDGSIPPGAQDRLSILARPPEVPRPGDSLPDEPDEQAWAERHEWLPDVRLVHPRLLWALQRITDGFPRRAVYVVSGYRPMARVGGGTMDDDGQGHRSLHADGRALDLHIHGVRNEDVFKACRALKDVGCGFYPTSKFVHVDVRRAHTGKAFWIDASAPGEPSRYVDSWPGVVESGAMGWLAPERRVPGPSGDPDAPSP